MRFRSFYWIQLCSAKCNYNEEVFVLLLNMIKCAISCANIDMFFMGEDMLITVFLWLYLV